MKEQQTIDYSDYRVWKAEESYEDNREYLEEYQEYTAEDVCTICKNLLEAAQAKGLEGCYLKFSSHYEQYEDYLGSPSVTACGYRKLSQVEVEEQARQDNIQAKADELGITFFEANILVQLQERGILKL